MKRILISLLIAALVCCACAMAAEQNVLQFDKNVNTVFEGETLQTVLNIGRPSGKAIHADCVSHLAQIGKAFFQ